VTAGWAPDSRVLEFGNMEKPEKKKKNNNKKIKLSEPWEIAAT
jgi:hypothetical protein